MRRRRGALGKGYGAAIGCLIFGRACCSAFVKDEFEGLMQFTKFEGGRRQSLWLGGRGFGGPINFDRCGAKPIVRCCLERVPMVRMQVGFARVACPVLYALRDLPSRGLIVC